MRQKHKENTGKMGTENANKISIENISALRDAKVLEYIKNNIDINFCTKLIEDGLNQSVIFCGDLLLKEVNFVVANKKVLFLVLEFHIPKLLTKDYLLAKQNLSIYFEINVNDTDVMKTTYDFSIELTQQDLALYGSQGLYKEEEEYLSNLLISALANLTPATV